MTTNEEVAKSVMRLAEHPEALDEPIRSFVMTIMARVQAKKAEVGKQESIMLNEVYHNGTIGDK